MDVDDTAIWQLVVVGRYHGTFSGQPAITRPGMVHETTLCTRRPPRTAREGRERELLLTDADEVFGRVFARRGGESAGALPRKTLTANKTRRGLEP